MKCVIYLQFVLFLFAGACQRRSVDTYDGKYLSSLFAVINELHFTPKGDSVFESKSGSIDFYQDKIRADIAYAKISWDKRVSGDGFVVCGSNQPFSYFGFIDKKGEFEMYKIPAEKLIGLSKKTEYGYSANWEMVLKNSEKMVTHDGNNSNEGAKKW